MSDASWYQQKIAQLRGTQPNPGIRTPTPQPQYSTTSSAPPQFRQVQQPVQQQPNDYDSQAKRPEVSMQMLLDVQRTTGTAKPGIGERLNPDPCPSCGAPNYFTNLGTNKRGPAPAPHCFTCGYNGGMFDQGEQATWMTA